MLEGNPCAISGFSLPLGKFSSSTGITQHCRLGPSILHRPLLYLSLHTDPSVPASGPFHILFFLPGQSFTPEHTPLLHHSTFYLFLKSQLKWYSDHTLFPVHFLPGTHQIYNYIFSCLMSLHLLESKISGAEHHVLSLPHSTSSVPYTVPST